MLNKSNCLVTLLVLLILDLRQAAVQGSGADNLKYPIILVPGDGGSQLEAKLDKPSAVHYFCDKKTNDYYSLWLNLADLVPFVIDCWVDNMKLVYDVKTRTTSSPPGVSIRIPGFGNTSTVEYVDPSQVSATGYFNILVEEMVKIGYVKGLNIRGAPYDFRKSPNELEDYYIKLTELIEETYKINSNTSSVLICHSMGCPVLLYYLYKRDSKWKDTYVKSLVTLAGAWGGAVKALKAFSSGDNLGVIVIPALTIRKDERTFPSLAFLLPSDQFWSHDEVIVSTPKKNYTVTDYKQFFQDINYTTGYEMWLDTKDLIHEMNPPNVEVHCLHGFGIDTMETLAYGEAKFPDRAPKITYGDGDGTVNTKSLRGCMKWLGKQYQKVYYQNFTKVDHMLIMSDAKVINYLKGLLIKQTPSKNIWDQIVSFFTDLF